MFGSKSLHLNVTVQSLMQQNCFHIHLLTTSLEANPDAEYDSTSAMWKHEAWMAHTQRMDFSVKLQDLVSSSWTFCKELHLHIQRFWMCCWGRSKCISTFLTCLWERKPTTNKLLFKAEIFFYVFKHKIHIDCWLSLWLQKESFAFWLCWHFAEQSECDVASYNFGNYT